MDANPRQTALMELKLAGIRHLESNDFFALFGTGVHPNGPPDHPAAPAAGP